MCVCVCVCNICISHVSLFNNRNLDVGEIVDEIKVLSWRWALVRINIPRVCTSNGVGTQGSVFCEWLKLIRCCYVLGDAVFCSFSGVGFLSVVGVRC